MRSTAAAPRTWRERIGGLGASQLIGLGCLFLALSFNGFVLFPELVSRTPVLNDHVFHLLNLERAAEALRQGQDPTDVWQPSIGQGYPVFHYYQHLPYLVTAGTAVVTGLDLVGVFKVTNYLLLCLFPLSVYWSVRRFGFSSLTAGTSSLLASILSTNALFGFDFASYVWAGHGLYTQLWGMFFLPLALGQAYHAISQGRGYALAVVLLAATALSHLAYGYIAVGSLAVMCLLVPRREELLRRLKRLAIIGGFFALATSYFLVPLILDRGYLNRSVWESDYKFDSFGAPTVLSWLFTGQILDFGHFPSITILAGAGLAVSVWRWRQIRYHVPTLIFAVWLLLYFGRPTWGFLLDLTPLSHDFFLHRLIGGVHLGAIYLAGIGVAAPLTWALRRSRLRYTLAALAVAALVLLPVFKDRIDYLHFNDALMERTDAAFTVEESPLDGLLAKLKDLPPGRVYAGLAGQWGKDYRVGDVPMYALLASQGYDTLRLYHSWSLAADVAVLFDERRPDEYNLFNIRYVVAPVERQFPDFVQPIGEYGRHRLYQVETTGYFDLVTSSIGFVGDKESFFAAASTWLDTSQVAAKEHPTVFFGESPRDVDLTVLPMSAAEDYLATTSFSPTAGAGSVISESAGGDRYSATVQVNRESVVMLKATYHPNWRASVDGRDASPRMLIPGYMGVLVQPGTHLIEFEYRAGELRHVLMVIGLLSVAVLAWLELRRERVGRLVGRLASSALAIRKTGAAAARLTEAPVRPQEATNAAGWESDLPHSALEEPAQGAEAADRTPPSTTGSQFQRPGLRPLAFVVGVVSAAVVAGLPLLRLQWMSGHDALAYMPRYVEFYKALAAGTWVPRWAPDLAFGHGEPTFNFNPPLVYYLTSGFHALGFDFVAAADLAMFGLLPLAGTGMYLLAGEFFGRRGGLVSGVAYVFAPYLLSRLYVSHALADYAAFAFMPFALWGLYRFCDQGRYLFLVIGSVSAALILLGSSMAAFMTFPALVLLVAWLWLTQRRPEILARGAWCVVLAVGLAAFFWLPSLAETSFVHIDRRVERIPYGDHFVDWWQLIHSPWGYGLSRAGSDDGMSFAIGPLYLIASAAALFFRRRIAEISPKAAAVVLFFFVTAGVSIFMTTGASRLIWDAVSPLQQLQFPFRFLQLVALSTAFLLGFPFLLLGERRRRLGNGLMVALVGGLLFFGLPHATPERYLDLTDAHYSPQNIAGQGIAATGREFEPIWVEEFPTTPAVKPTLTFVGGSGVVTGSDRTATSQLFVVDVSEDSLVRSSTFYFPGWTLYVDDSQRAVAPGSPHGLLEFYLESGRRVLLFRFQDTPVRSISAWMSLIALGLLVVTPAIRWRPRLGRFRSGGR